MSTVFVSYSRKDKEFVKKLHQAFSEVQRDVWVDWKNIPPNADWRHEIQQGIIASDIFLFVLSPDSVASYECGVEIAQAIKHNKRLIPIVYREVDYEAVHPRLAALNWIFLREEDDFNIGFQKLIQAIDTDLDGVRTHTRLLQRAIEWDSKKRDRCFLLRGNDLKEAREWLDRASDKQPLPTALHEQYINASAKAQAKKYAAIFTVVSLDLVLTSFLGLATFSLQKVVNNHHHHYPAYAQNSDFEEKFMAEESADEGYFVPTASIDTAVQSVKKDNALCQRKNGAMKILKQQVKAVKGRNFLPKNKILASTNPDSQIVFWVVQEN